MKLRYITCSDPREYNSLQNIVDLAKMPHAEIAVQCHPSKMSKGMPRNMWFDDLVRLAFHIDMNLAIHINKEWADSMCVHGKIPNEIFTWMALERFETNQPIIKRIQLNMPQDTANHINTYEVAKLINDFPNREFIFQYNNKTKNAIRKLHETGAEFSLLFDASGGNGIAPESWQKPVYKIHPMGYSGGISPDNVIENLNKISMVVPQNNKIWIDAEGKLKSVNPAYCDLSPRFDYTKASEYVKRANAWQNQKTK